MGRTDREAWADSLRAELKEHVAGSSLRDVAAKISGVSYGTINNLINGRDVPSERTLRATDRWLRAQRESAPAVPLDEWGAANARTMERLAALLEKDQVIIELRARAELLRLELQARAAVSEPTDDQQLGAQGARSIAEAERLERAASARERSAGRSGVQPGHGRDTTSP